MDHGRMHLLAQAGVLFKMARNKYYPAVISSEISFIKQIKLFQKFTLTTRLVAWDNVYWYIEQKFLIGEIIHAIAHVRGLILKNGKRVALDEVFRLTNADIKSPDFSEPIKAWIDLLESKKQNKY